MAYPYSGAGTGAGAGSAKTALPYPTNPSLAIPSAAPTTPYPVGGSSFALPPRGGADAPPAYHEVPSQLSMPVTLLRAAAQAAQHGSLSQRIAAIKAVLSILPIQPLVSFDDAAWSVDDSAALRSVLTLLAGVLEQATEQADVTFGTVALLTFTLGAGQLSSLLVLVRLLLEVSDRLGLGDDDALAMCELLQQLENAVSSGLGGSGAHRHRAITAVTWACVTCANVNVGDTDCTLCQAPRPRLRRASSARSGLDDAAAVAEPWTCTLCMSENSAADGVCVLCGGARPGAAELAPWLCIMCNTNNDASHAVCSLCGSGRPPAAADDPTAAAGDGEGDDSGKQTATNIRSFRDVAMELLRVVAEQAVRVDAPVRGVSIPLLVDVRPAADGAMVQLLASLKAKLADRRGGPWQECVRCCATVMKATAPHTASVRPEEVNEWLLALQSLSEALRPTDECWPVFVEALVAIVSLGGSDNTVKVIASSLNQPALCGALLEPFVTGIVHGETHITDVAGFTRLMQRCLVSDDMSLLRAGTRTMGAYLEANPDRAIVAMLLEERVVARNVFSLVTKCLVAPAPEQDIETGATGLMLLAQLAKLDAEQHDRCAVRLEPAILSHVVDVLLYPVAAAAVSFLSAMVLGHVYTYTDAAAHEELPAPLSVRNIELIRNPDVFSAFMSVLLTEGADLPVHVLAMAFRLVRAMLGHYDKPVTSPDSGLPPLFADPYPLVADYRLGHCQRDAPIAAVLLPARAMFKKRHQLRLYHVDPPAGYVSLGDVAYLQEEVTNIGSGVGMCAKLPVGTEFAMVAFPTRFESVAHIDPLAGFSECTVWRAVPPAGYSAIGCVVTAGDTPPDLRSVGCLHESLVKEDQAIQRLCSIQAGRHLWRGSDCSRTFRVEKVAFGMKEQSRAGSGVSTNAVNPLLAHLLVSVSELALRHALTPDGNPLLLRHVLPLLDSLVLRFSDIQRKWRAMEGITLSVLFRNAQHAFAFSHGEKLTIHNTLSVLVNTKCQPLCDELRRAKDVAPLVQQWVVGPMGANRTQPEAQRQGIKILFAMFKGNPHWSASLSQALRTSMWEAIISALHLFASDTLIQYQGSLAASMLSPTMPDGRRMEARIACKHAWHLFEALGDSAKVKDVTQAMAVTKNGNCTIQ